MTPMRWIAVALTIAIVLTIALTIAITGPPIVITGPPPLPEPESVPPAGACVDWRWIGIKTDPAAPCPDPADNGLPGWTGLPLFDDDLQYDPVPALRNFCLYEKAEGEVVDDDLTALKNLRLEKFEQLERDCLVVVPAAGAPAAGAEEQATAAEQNRVETLRDVFLANAGVVSTPAATQPAAAQPAVQLALLDTSPTSPPSPDATITGTPQNHPPSAKGSRHGYTLANLAADMLCGGGVTPRCVAQITSRLALPVKKFDARQWQAGDRAENAESGYVGTLGDLAMAIRDELTAWEEIGSSAGPRRRLVLNLALGWDPALFGARQDTYPAVQAVYLALQKAACQDVLVVAAAGNLLGGPKETGPLLPAGWETEQAPPCAGDRPLLYAAGGVRADGRPLANARPGGMPRLVAFGDHAVSWNSQHGATATLTGSSVATLITAATAAAVWNDHPHLSPHDVMKHLYNKGVSDVSPAPEADFFLPQAGQPPVRRRVMLCKALGTCPSTLPAPPQLPSPTMIRSSKLPSFRASTPTSKKIVRPFSTYPGIMARPWLGPQPESDPCPPCYEDPANQGFAGTTTSSTLVLKLDPQFDASLLADAIVVVKDTTGNVTVYDLSKVSWTAYSGWIEITGVKVNAGDYVTLEFTLLNSSGKPERSALSALLVQ